MTISSNVCKKAVVNYVTANPGHVAKQFCDVPAEQVTKFEQDATKTSNWKRFEKENESYGALKGLTRRGFDCRPYDDQLRAYTWDDGNKIVKVVVEGE